MPGVDDPKVEVVGEDPSVEAYVLVVPESQEDEATGLVWTLGCSGITIEQASGGSVRLVCFFADPGLHSEGMGEVARAFSTEVTRVSVPNPDWVRRFRDTFGAFDAPPFRIVPEWDQPPPANNGLAIRVDPGRAFGTGTHESTRLCLQALGAIARALPPAPRTLDLGCGTGILGIGAAKLLKAFVVACDFDPLATASARRHASLNDAHLDVLLMDGCRGLSPGRFQLVLANLMAPFLISRAAEIAAVGAPGCRYILAGLLRDEEVSVRKAWPPDWPVKAAYEGEWASLLYERP